MVDSFTLTLPHVPALVGIQEHIGSVASVPWVSSDDLSAYVMSHLARLRTPVNSYFTVCAVVGTLQLPLSTYFSYSAQCRLFIKETEGFFPVYKKDDNNNVLF